MPEFSSAFGERFSNFLDYRTARGYRRETYLRHFIKFDCWCMENHPEQTELNRELVLEWLNGASVSSYNTAQRVASIRCLVSMACSSLLCKFSDIELISSKNRVTPAASSNSPRFPWRKALVKAPCS